jgi:hypothetical protein
MTNSNDFDGMSRSTGDDPRKSGSAEQGGLLRMLSAIGSAPESGRENRLLYAGQGPVGK